MIEIDLSELEGASKKLERLSKTAPEQYTLAMEEIGDLFTTALRENIRKWSGEGEKAIKKETNEKGVLIYGPGYSYFLEYGHRFLPGAWMRSRRSKLARWCMDKGVSKWYLVNRKYLADPHPFIKPSIKMVEFMLPEILERYGSRAVLNSGIGQK